MTQKDMESIVSGIKKLNGVLVITVPDCLLYSAWQASEDAWDAEVGGAYVGQLLASGTEGLRSVDEWSGLAQLTLELSEGLMVVRPTKRGDFAVAYIFEPGTPLGWVRMQVERTYPAITAGLDSEHAESAAETETGTEAETVITAEAADEDDFSVLSTELSADVAEDIIEDEFEDAFAEPPPNAPAKPADARPNDAPTIAGVKMSKPPAPAAASAPEPAPGAGEHKGKRLITYLGEHTGDTHAALLRVSLQTGLPLTRLREPEKLSEEEYAKVEESVRLILGVEQLNL